MDRVNNHGAAQGNQIAAEMLAALDRLRPVPPDISLEKRVGMARFGLDASGLYGAEQVDGVPPGVDAFEPWREVTGSADVSTPIGNIGASRTKNPGGWRTDFHLKNNIQVPVGSLDVGAHMNSRGQGRRVEATYTTPMLGGDLAVRGAIGRDDGGGKLRDLQLQYLRQIGKNSALGVYGGIGSSGANAGLQFTGRF
jgi:hypothetical protein